GMNEFRVVARDRFDNESDPSGAIYIHANAEPVRNLSVSLSSVGAVAAGQTTPVTDSVEKNGNIALPATDVKVSVYRQGARDTLAIELVPALEPGDAWHTTLGWDVDASGIVTFEAWLDTGRVLDEVSTTDNYAATDTRATTAQVPYLMLSASDEGAMPGDVRALAWQLANPAVVDYQGQMVFSLETIGGQQLNVLAEAPLSSLPSGEAVSGRQSFTVPPLQPGDYRIRASFVSDAVG